jgi:hypothetical protein
MPASTRQDRLRRLLSLCASAGFMMFVALITALPAHGADEMAQRRLQVARMTPTEQQELLRKQEQFLALPPEQQDRFRALQAAIDADPHADRLRTVLKEYHEWLKTLSPGERAELSELPPEQRVQRIKQIKERQHAARVQAQRAEVLTSRDMRAILHWTEEFLWQHKDRVLKEVSSSWRKKIEKEDQQKQRRALLLVASFSSRRGGSHPMTLVKQEDIEALAAKLSEPAQQELKAASELAEQRKIVGGWIGASMQRLEPWQGRRKLPPPVEDELAQFFEQDLRPQQRERLLKMPNDQMREELRRMYFERERWDPSFAGRGGMPPDGRQFEKGKGPRPRRASLDSDPTEKRAEPDATEPSKKPEQSKD